MPINDPGGHWANGGAVNQGGPVGNTGSSGGGQNFGSAYGGSRPFTPNAGRMVLPFGWQPTFYGAPSPDVVSAFTNPNAVNYTDSPMIGMPTRSEPSWFGAAPAYDRNPASGGGYNSGQGGMGAGGIFSVLMNVLARGPYERQGPMRGRGGVRAG